MAKSSITPIFYLGAPRNGTTWMGNILNQVFGIPSASHPLHYGVKESAICQNNLYWGDISNVDNYIRFLSIYSEGDFFKLVGGDKEFFYARSYNNFYSFFFQLMDSLAEREGKPYWCTKFDPLLFIKSDQKKIFEKELLSRYANVRFIAINRDFYEYLRSYINMPGKSFNRRNNLKVIALLLGTARYTVYYREISNIINKYKGLSVKYEKLIEKYEEQLVTIESYLNLSSKRTEVLTKRNRSFRPKSEDDGILKYLYPFLRLLKSIYWICRVILKIYDFKKIENPIYYRLLKEKYFQKDLMNNLESTNNLILLDDLSRSGTIE